MKQISDEVFAQVREALLGYSGDLGRDPSDVPALAALDTEQPVQVNAMLVEALQAAEKLEHEALVALSEATYELKVGNTYTTATDTYKANNDLIHRLDKILNLQYRDRKRAALTAAQQAQPVQVNALLVEDVNSEIVKRYKVEKTKGGFWPYCVKAGDGAMELFFGSRKQVDHVQQALQSACLDGAFMAITAAKQAQPVCGYDDTTGNCTRVNCCKQAQPERALSDAVWLSELLRRALPYVKDASVRYYDGTDGHSMRQSAKGLLEKIEAAIKQGGQQ